MPRLCLFLSLLQRLLGVSPSHLIQQIMEHVCYVPIILRRSLVERKPPSRREIFDSIPRHLPFTRLLMCHSLDIGRTLDPTAKSQHLRDPSWCRRRRWECSAISDAAIRKSSKSKQLYTATHAFLSLDQLYLLPDVVHVLQCAFLRKTTVVAENRVCDRH